MFNFCLVTGLINLTDNHAHAIVFHFAFVRIQFFGDDVTEARNGSLG